MVRRAAMVMAVLLTLTGCDSALDRNPLPTSASTAPSGTAVESIVPVTPDGFLSGPGVTDETITLGVLVDPTRDRGFTAGVQLWQQTVNSSGGLCGRTLRLAVSGGTDIPTDPVDAYDVVGRSSLGLITLAGAADSAALTARISADQLPALTPVGSSAQLGPTRPIIVGATADILAINGLDYLLESGGLAEEDTVVVLTDGSPEADNALLGAQWWADAQNITLDVRQVPTTSDGATVTSGQLGDWTGVTAVLALTGPATTATAVEQTPDTVTVLTGVDGYDPATWSEAALAAATAGRVLVATSTPAFGSDYPAAVAIASRLAATGQTNPGPRLLDGYATGVNWGRLLTLVCADRTLTREAIQQAISTVGAASVDSLFGPTDPAAAAVSGLPTTRVSAMAAADPAAPAGLRPLTWLQAAAGIENYTP